MRTSLLWKEDLYRTLVDDHKFPQQNRMFLLRTKCMSNRRLFWNKGGMSMGHRDMKINLLSNIVCAYSVQNCM